jgi:hypothetical protein
MTGTKQTAGNPPARGDDHNEVEIVSGVKV